MLIEVEVIIKLNAGKNKHSKERTGYRSGYRSRQYNTRLGTIELEIPKVRKVSYIPFFISSSKRSKMALMSVIQSAYINGVSTRKIEELAKSLGITGISSSQVSNIVSELDTLVSEFRNRSYPR